MKIMSIVAGIVFLIILRIVDVLLSDSLILGSLIIVTTVAVIPISLPINKEQESIQKEKKEKELKNERKHKELIDRLDELIEIRNNSIKQTRSVKKPAIEEENLRFELWKARFSLMNHKRKLAYNKTKQEKKILEINQMLLSEEEEVKASSKLETLTTSISKLEKKIKIDILSIKECSNEFFCQEALVKNIRKQVRKTEKVANKQRLKINDLSLELSYK